MTSARLTIFKTLASGTSAELTLITSRTSSTNTLAKQTLLQTKTGKKPNLRNFGEENYIRKTVSKNDAHALYLRIPVKVITRRVLIVFGEVNEIRTMKITCIMFGSLG